jgi:RNA polymerase sigma-70 factor (ECF subfamily)
MTFAQLEQAQFGSQPRGEEALVAAARAMDQRAWDAIYTAHYAPVYRYCAYRISDHAAAEDLAAEVFCEAVKGIGRFNYRGITIRAWLYRIAHNLTVDERRRRMRTQTVTLEDSPAMDVPTGDFVGELADRGAIRLAMRSLTDDQQQCIVLRFLEGLSLSETAAVMNRPAGAVKALQHRAVLRLRTLLGEEGS